MSDLPNGWAIVALPQVAVLIDTRRIPLNADERTQRIAGKAADSLVPYYGATGQVGWIDEALFDENLVLLGEDGAPFLDLQKQKAYRIVGKSWVNNHAHVLRAREGVLDWRLLEHQLNSIDYTGFVTGTTRLKLTQGAMNTLPILVPPFQEQTRIANQLDTLLARVQACNNRFDAIPALLKRFRQTVLDAATTGALTQDWRDAQSKTAHESLEPGWAKAKALHALPAGWRWAKFSEFLSGFRSGTSAVPGGDPSAYPVLRSSSVRPMGIDFEDVRYLPNMTKVRSDDLLIEGEMLFTRLSGSLEYVANCAVVRGLGDRKIYYPDRLFRARLIRPEHGTYFEFCFASPLLREHLTVEAKSTAGHQRISMGAVTNFPIPMPPDDEQAEIVRRVEVLFALADRIEARCTAARAQAQRLSPLVLAKAFRGELVQQDPNDEPASALLARIASSNSAVVGKNRQKVPVGRKELAQAAIDL
jgi:type I restriction enzyme, S subunit